jgi:hypothetical protein
MKAKEYIEAESFVINNPDCPVISKEDALKAIEMAVKETKEKAVEAFKYAYKDIWGACFEHDLNRFKNKLEGQQ